MYVPLPITGSLADTLPCPDCKGLGGFAPRYPQEPQDICEVCDGSGVAVVWACSDCRHEYESDDQLPMNVGEMSYPQDAICDLCWGKYA